MTEISFNAKNIPWALPSNFKAGGVGGASAAAGASGAGGVGAISNLTITSAGSEETTAVEGVAVTDLTPSSSCGSAELGAALAKSSSTTSGLASIYALLALLLETANEQKMVASMAKQADIAVQQSSIQAQADAQRSSGLFNAILGTVTAAVSGGLSVGGAIQGLKGMSTQSKIAQNYGLPDLAQQVKGNFSGMESQQSKVASLEAQLQGIQGGANGNQTQATSAAKGANPTGNNLSKLQGEINANGSGKGQGQGIEMQDLAAVKSNGSGNNVGEVQKPAVQEMNAKPGEGGGAKVDNGEAPAKSAESDVQNKVDTSEMSQQEKLVNDVNETLNNGSEKILEGDSAQVKDLKTQIAAEKSKLQECSNKYNESQKNLSTMEAVLQHDSSYIEAGRSIKQSELLQGLAMPLNGVGQSLVNGISTCMNAEATAMGSVTKGYEGQEERDKAMIDDAAKLQQQVLQTFAQIIQTEAQTASSIIHA